MYLQGLISIDPSQLTEIHRVRPTKGFARVAHLLTGGLVKSREERETFCAVTILQQINIVMRSVGVDNIVRLAKDDTIIYEDTEGREDDLKDALDAFASRSKTEDVKRFDSLNLVLEHSTDDLSVLIDIRINRSHEVGQYPIEITLNGLARDLGAQDGEDHVRGELEKVFSSQSSYDDYVTKRKESFVAFLGLLKEAFSKHMGIDDIQMNSSVKIIRPKSQTDSGGSRADLAGHYDDPVFAGHHGTDAAFFYAWLWAEQCHNQDINCHDVTVVDAQGNDIFDVGEQGFQAGESDTMNVNADFVLPETDDIEVLDGHAFAAEISDPNASTTIPSSGGDIGSGDSGGWFSAISDSFSFDSGGGCGGSSCGSSCGGGCGGG